MRNNLFYLAILFFTGIIIFQSCSNEQEINYRRYFVNGKGLYEKNCQNCHGAGGEGLNKLYPPLTDTAFLANNKSKLSCIIKRGLHEKITVNHISYENEMPGSPALADIDIAQIIVYITNSFGNNQGFYDAASVTSDLRNCN